MSELYFERTIKEEIVEFAKSRREKAKSELEKLGYFDENWCRINDLVGEDIGLAYRLGRYEATYDLMNELLRVVGEIIYEEVKEKLENKVKSGTPIDFPW